MWLLAWPGLPTGLFSNKAVSKLLVGGYGTGHNDASVETFLIILLTSGLCYNAVCLGACEPFCWCTDPGRLQNVPDGHNQAP